MLQFLQRALEIPAVLSVKGILQKVKMEIL